VYLLAVYLGLLTVGEVGAYVLGQEIEIVAPAWSLSAFLATFFFMIWAAWRLAVRLT
jgi:hypothetical protein